MRLARFSKIPALLAAVAVALAAGCTNAPDQKAAQVPDGSFVLPTGPAQVMVASRYLRGFSTLNFTHVRAPRVIVYSDGRVIAEAHRVLTLSRAEVERLTLLQRRDLAGFGPTVASRPDADAPTGVLHVRTAAGDLQEVSAYALGVDRDDLYPRELVAAWNRLEDLRKRVEAEGVAYTSDRVRLVAGPRTAAGPVTDWPAGVPVPPVTRSGVREGELAAAAAAALIQSMPSVYETPGLWPTLRLPDGSLVGVAWRYLLPDEYQISE